MFCPYCSNQDTKVIDSRVNNNEVRRRRECEKCTKRFTTYEAAELSLTVLKKDGRRDPFSNEKILNGIQNACGKLNLSQEQLELMANKVEQKVRKLGREEVKSSRIGTMVMKELLKTDKVAYLRFASICKSFDDPKLFEKEIAMIRS